MFIKENNRFYKLKHNTKTITPSIINILQCSAYSTTGKLQKFVTCHYKCKYY